MKVVIMGLGGYKEGSGISAAKFFISRGVQVLITDLKSEKDLAHQIAELKNFCKKNKKPLPKFVLGEHREADILAAGMVVRNPGVPGDSKFLALAKSKNIPVETDISIFMKNCLATVVSVTGTRGKSTTTSLIYEFLRDANASNYTRMPRKIRIWLGGNIKISPLSFADKVKANDIVVLELSSWMLENFKDEGLTPHVAVVTNIYPDHLNTYAGMAEYAAAKENIFACQTEKDFLIVNGENVVTKKWKGRGRTIKFYKKDAIGIKSNLLGAHNLENIAAAIAAVKVFSVKKSVVAKVLKNFQGLPDRQELVAEINGVKYINDTTATTPDGTIAALRAFDKKAKSQKHALESHRGSKVKSIILICGGKDKNLEYAGLAKEIKKYCKAVIFFPGTATEKIKKEISNFHQPAGGPISNIFAAKNMEDAVNLAKKQAVRGDIVLLSPAAASFGLFINEFDRGEKFKKSVKRL